MHITQPEVRRKAATMLLEHGAQGPSVSEALKDALEEYRVDEDLVLLLLKGADINDARHQPLSKAMVSSPKTLVSSIIQISRPEEQTLVAALSAVLDPQAEDRQTKLALLLPAGIDPGKLSDPLLQEVKNKVACDLTVVKTFLQRGASCSFQNGEAIELAILSRNVELLKLLIKSKPEDRTLASKLPTAIAMDGIENDVRYRLVSMLVEGGARGEELNRSLVLEVQRAASCNLRIIGLLIRHGARVDFSNGGAIRHVIVHASNAQI